MNAVTKHEVLVLGGGPGGSHAATILAKAGVDVGLVEREEYPRFHIGESLLPASMPLFKETGFYDVLAAGKYIEKYGAVFIDYRNDDQVRFGFDGGFNTEIPMAFEVERAHFDKDILAYAAKSGAKVYQPERVLEVDVSKDGVRVGTDKHHFEAKYVIDATGRDTFLGKKFTKREMHKDLNNVAVFSHFKGVKRFEGLYEGDITIGLLPEASWTWIIPFKGDVTSVGVVASSRLFDKTKPLEEYLMDSLNASPSVRDIMKNAVRVADLVTIANYSHESDKFYGDRWILAGDAAKFLDPIFSSGVHVSCTTSKAAAETILRALPNGTSLETPGFGDEYEVFFRRGADRFHHLIQLFYEGHFVAQMKKTLTLENMRKAFTSAVAGDVWNEENVLFQKKVL